MTSPESRNDGQTIFISGAGAGLGRTYAMQLAQEGAAAGQEGPLMNVAQSQQDKELEFWSCEQHAQEGAAAGQ